MIRTASCRRKNMEAFLVLEDGKVFKGRSFGAPGERTGEVVFNTSMCGYQEIITDPSYKGQIVAMTYPLMGNYGINRDDVESRRPFLEGFAVKEYSKIASNWSKEQSLGDYLRENGIPGIEGIDTRELTLHIREKGAMKAVLSTLDSDRASLLNKARGCCGLVGVDLVKDVSVEEKYKYPFGKSGRAKYRVAVLDCGVKYNILRELASLGCEVTVFPADSTCGQILELKPDGVLLSNGPGDPAALEYVINTVSELVGKVPLFGICLGHQIIGLALGGNTYKLKFGHHGANHPVKELKTGKVSITSQNHGFCVDIKSLSGKDVELTHVNLNDNTAEGFRHKKLPVFSVQFHPEASPGPHDAKYLFADFVKMMDKWKSKRDAKKKRH
ncbi:MAG: glutamine-hydrolyzing carbamoyl-phosphate synthase small subunit [Candidatus Omnitrophica bacterium]|nr:glutamine-hydrolyzing carbamoyl-phosphate synthase small subunit [Candidatus Omnitrophota bacterium]MDD5042530.1 glutamine-hydrolyzing carbamoyl-phosphate synthase small subunit [Candidatus Omnitrophota bacterium]MDD5501694.1 glutamine-hydrolyzing carbamoyl-phosphate synthase small subunit [Candidatus Omnitrophota bacterium]